jgi:hypothetical protein
VKVEQIMGCYKDGPLMTRLHLLTTPWFKVYLHLFHRSDEDRELHDHPWSFVSLILWGGYHEVRPIRDNRQMLKQLGGAEQHWNTTWMATERVRVRPLSVLFRPAWWAHRVELEQGRVSVSLVAVFRKAREWGFFTRSGWRHHRQFISSRDCG